MENFIQQFSKKEEQKYYVLNSNYRWFGYTSAGQPISGLQNNFETAHLFTFAEIKKWYSASMSVLAIISPEQATNCAQCKDLLYKKFVGKIPEGA